MSENRNKIAIIGDGCAGAECLKALRENGYCGEVHVFTDSEWPVYSPMLTTYFAAGKIGFERLFPYGGDEFYRQYRAEVHPGSPVISLDAEKRVVANRSGFELNYEQCLIASGASPLLPPIEGLRSHNLYLMRTVEDAVRLKKALAEKPRKALVIGASLVGIKLMELFHEAGMEVCLADLAGHLFPLNAHPECALLIEDRLSGLGIKLRLGACLKRVEESPAGIRAYFDDSPESEEAALLALCTGVRPNMSFIDRSQVEIKEGVLVGEQMQTGVPGLYAAGDVSQGRNLLTGSPQIIGLWANARYQGRTAGRIMAGIKETFPGNIPHNIVHFLGMDFVSMGNICEYDKMEMQSDGQRFRQLFWRDGRLTGANFLGALSEAGVIKNALMKGLRQDGSSYGRSSTAIQDILVRRTLEEVEKA